MFSLFRKKKQSPPKSPVSLDMHSHLIPGIDDGAKDIEDSLSLIQDMVALGYRHIITTPHIYQELYPNKRETILDGLQKLRSELDRKQIPVVIDAAAEYFLDEHFHELLSKKSLLTINKNFVLVEMSFMAAPPKVEDYLFEMQMKGYRPIMAHPERYNFLSNTLDRFERLKDLGCYFQLNLLSLQGSYGSKCQKTAEKLLKAGMIDFLGTDLHNSNHLEALQELFSSHYFSKLIMPYQFTNDMLA